MVTFVTMVTFIYLYSPPTFHFRPLRFPFLAFCLPLPVGSLTTVRRTLGLYAPAHAARARAPRCRTFPLPVGSAFHRALHAPHTHRAHYALLHTTIPHLACLRLPRPPPTAPLPLPPPRTRAATAHTLPPPPTAFHAAPPPAATHYTRACRAYHAATPPPCHLPRRPSYPRLLPPAFCAAFAPARFRARLRYYAHCRTLHTPTTTAPCRLQFRFEPIRLRIFFVAGSASYFTLTIPVQRVDWFPQRTLVIPT